MNIPTDLKYTSTDEWIKVEGKIATVGVTDYAQDQLSDIVFVEILVSVGKEFSKGTTLATIESVKAAADVTLPISGKIIEVNESLSQAPETINSSPYDKSWMVKLELTAPDELNQLMDATDYEQNIAQRSH